MTMSVKEFYHDALPGQIREMINALYVVDNYSPLKFIQYNTVLINDQTTIYEDSLQFIEGAKSLEELAWISPHIAEGYKESMGAYAEKDDTSVLMAFLRSFGNTTMTYNIAVDILTTEPEEPEELVGYYADATIEGEVLEPKYFVARHEPTAEELADHYGLDYDPDRGDIIEISTTDIGVLPE
jgi:hypothetical protein